MNNTMKGERCLLQRSCDVGTLIFLYIWHPFDSCFLKRWTTFIVSGAIKNYLFRGARVAATRVTIKKESYERLKQGDKKLMIR